MKDAVIQAYTLEQESRRAACQIREDTKTSHTAQNTDAPVSATPPAEAKAAEALPPFERRASLVLQEGDTDNPSFQSTISIRFTGDGNKEGKANAIFQHIKGFSSVYGLDVRACYDGKK